MRIRQTLIVAAAAALVGAATGFVLEEQSVREGARLFEQVLANVQNRYVDSVAPSSLYEKAAEGLVAQLNDPYSELFSPEELKQFTTTTGGRYGGVGMLIEDQQGAIVIQRVYPNTPAERAGIHEGDRILEINGESTRGWKTKQVSDKMQGEPNTKVHVKFTRQGSPLEVDFTRAIIHIPAVPYALMLDGGIAYVPLQTFNETAASEVSAQLVRLQHEGAKGAVLDLRGNTGGLLDQALRAANLFLKRGTEIASVRSRANEIDRYVAETDPVAPSMPLVILTDGSSASASEIVAGALQDHDRALIVGTTSFGKGLVQSMLPLDGGWALKLTTGKWYTPSGRSIHKPRTPAELDEIDTSSAPEDVSKRPAFKSDAGRTVYGGGAITPDVFIRPDTITTPERALAQKLLAKQQEVYLAVYDYALALRSGVRPTFSVQQAWRDELYKRVHDRGVDVTKAEWDAGHEYVDRLLSNWVARLAFGDSTAKRRSLDDDVQLETALRMLRTSHSQQDLFTVAAAQSPQKQKSKN